MKQVEAIRKELRLAYGTLAILWFAVALRTPDIGNQPSALDGLLILIQLGMVFMNARRWWRLRPSVTSTKDRSGEPS